MIMRVVTGKVSAFFARGEAGEGSEQAGKGQCTGAHSGLGSCLQGRQSGEPGAIASK